MLNIWSKEKWSWLLMALGAGLLCVASAWPQASGQNSRAGRVVGNIDGISLDGGQFHVSGWACQQGNPGSIEVHIYADRSAYDKPPGTFVTAGRADFVSEPPLPHTLHTPTAG